MGSSSRQNKGKKKDYRNGRGQKSYRKNIAINFILLSIIPLIVFGLVTVHMLSDELKEDAGQKNMLLTESLAEEINRFMLFHENILNDIVDNFGKQRFRDEAAAREYLNSLILHHDSFESIQIVGNDSSVIFNAPLDEKMLGYSMEYHPAITSLTAPGKVYWSSPFLSLQTGDVSLTASVLSGDYIIVTYIKLDFLSSIVAMVKAGVSGYAFITDSNGIVIGHPDKTIVAQRRNFYNLDIIREGISGNPGTYLYVQDGTEYIGSLKMIPETGWAVVVTQPTSQAFMLAKYLQYLLWSLVFATLVVAFGLAIWSSGRIIRPLLSFTSQAKNIADGNYSVNIQPAGYEEFARLGDSFMAMAATIKKRENALQKAHDELENRVKERTKELVKSEQRLISANKELKELDVKKDQFISLAAHELRTPLTSIRGFTQMLRSPKVLENKEKVTEYLRVIDKSTTRLYNLVGNLVECTKINLGKVGLNIYNIGIKPIFNDIKDNMEVMIRDKGLKPRFEIKGNPTVKADPDRLVQVIGNLMENALEFTDKGEIGFKVYKKGRFVWFEVSDTGTGIPKEKHKTIFERFYQVKNKYKKEVKGSGLGLFISKGFVELMGGKIWVESELGKGSTFYFTIPSVR